MDQFNYMMICKTKYIEDLMFIYIFPSITLREGRKFNINTTKRWFRLIDSWWKVLSFFIRPFTREPSILFELLLFSIFHFLFTNFGRLTFCEKTIQGYVYLICIINRLHDANEPLSKDILRLCSDLLIQKKPGYLEFCEMCGFSVVQLSCKHDRDRTQCYAKKETGGRLPRTEILTNHVRIVILSEIPEWYTFSSRFYSQDKAYL